MHKEAQEKTSQDMDKDVDDMKTLQIILIKIIVQGKSNIRKRAAFASYIAEGRINKAREGDVAQPDIRVFLNPDHVVHYEWGFQRIGINDGTNDGENKKQYNNFRG
jgi:hypothetical protein